MAASAVLFSGGLDSAVLLAARARDRDAVWPDPRARGARLGRRRSARDRAAARGAAVRRTRRAASRRSTVDMRDVYPPTHWAVVGQPPAYDTPDEDVYLEGRNIVLIVEGGGAVRAARRSRASRSARSPAIRFPTRRRSSSTTMARAHVARPRLAQLDDRRAARRDCTRKTSSGSAASSACRSSSRCRA